MTTVKELIEILSKYNQDQRITNEQGEDFIHVSNTQDGNTILSTYKPIAYCDRSGGYVFPSVVDGYFGYSIELDEDVLQIETTPLD